MDKWPHVTNSQLKEFCSLFLVKSLTKLSKVYAHSGLLNTNTKFVRHHEHVTTLMNSNDCLSSQNKLQTRTEMLKTELKSSNGWYQGEADDSL